MPHGRGHSRGPPVLREILRELLSGYFEELGYPYWRALAELDLGRFLAGDDRADEAEKPLLSAAETFEELGARPALDRTRTLLGSLPS